MKQIAISVESHKANEHQTYYAIERNGRTIVSCIEQTPAKARKSLASDLLEHAERSVKADRNTRENTIVCNDGTWLVVGWDAWTMSWGYRIAGPDRDTPCSSGCGRADYAEAMTDATKHAEQSYGGVVRVIRTRL